MTHATRWVEPRHIHVGRALPGTYTDEGGNSNADPIVFLRHRAGNLAVSGDPATLARLGVRIITAALALALPVAAVARGSDALSKMVEVMLPDEE